MCPRLPAGSDVQRREGIADAGNPGNFDSISVSIASWLSPGPVAGIGSGWKRSRAQKTHRNRAAKRRHFRLWISSAYLRRLIADQGRYPRPSAMRLRLYLVDVQRFRVILGLT